MSELMLYFHVISEDNYFVHVYISLGRLEVLTLHDPILKRNAVNFRMKWISPCWLSLATEIYKIIKFDILVALNHF